MAIIRIAKRDMPYVMIDREQIQRDDLSWKAKGLYAYLLSLPDHWAINTRDLTTRASDGETVVRSALKELRSKGFIETVPNVRDKNGHLGGSETLFFERPKHRDVENPHVGVHRDV